MIFSQNKKQVPGKQIKIVLSNTQTKNQTGFEIFLVRKYDVLNLTIRIQNFLQMLDSDPFKMNTDHTTLVFFL
jgi:hypothetical protein